MPDVDTLSSSLLQQVRIGDQSAWIRLADLYGPLVYSWARRGGLEDADAADVTQDVFLKVSTQISRFRREQPGDSFRGWLFTICRNQIHTHRRKRLSEPRAGGGTSANQRIQALEGKVKDYEVADVTSQQDRDDVRWLRARAAILLRDQFKPVVWAAFWRTTVDGQPPGDVAEELQVSIWAVYKAKARVLQRLREELADEQS